MVCSHAPDADRLPEFPIAASDPPTGVADPAPARGIFAPMEVRNDAADVWSKARIACLRNHHSLGLTAAESARLLGGVTKNAVISKRRRLGLFGWREQPDADPAQTPVRRKRKRTTSVWVGPPPLPTEPLPDMDRPPPVDADPKPLADRGLFQCAWPLGPAEEPGDFRTLFCCAPVRGAGSYCACHRRLASRRI